MTPEKIEATATRYYDLLIPRYRPVRWSDDIFAVIREYHPDNKTDYLQHACAMSLKIVEFIHLGKVGKANRWLGYLQCLLVITGTVSPRDCALHNAPEEETTYNRDG